MSPSSIRCAISNVFPRLSETPQPTQEHLHRPHLRQLPHSVKPTTSPDLLWPANQLGPFFDHLSLRKHQDSGRVGQPEIFGALARVQEINEDPGGPRRVQKKRGGMTTNQEVAGSGFAERGRYYNAAGVHGVCECSVGHGTEKSPILWGFCGAAREEFEPSLTDPESGSGRLFRSRDRRS